MYVYNCMLFTLSAIYSNSRQKFHSLPFRAKALRRELLFVLCLGIVSRNFTAWRCCYSLPSCYIYWVYFPAPVFRVHFSLTLSNFKCFISIKSHSVTHGNRDVRIFSVCYVRHIIAIFPGCL